MQEHATRIITEAGVCATGEELRGLITVASTLALEDCFSVLPPDAATPEHVAHLTSLKVVQVETDLRDLTALTLPHEQSHPDVRVHAAALGQRLDPRQLEAAAAVASSDPLVIVEGAAGAGKTTMLATAIRATEAKGGCVRVVAPTKRAADVAHQELGVPAESVASLVHAHGSRWNGDGVWTRLVSGNADPSTGTIYSGLPREAQLRAGDRIVVDEAGMLNQDTAPSLFTVAAETGATHALIGDRAQLAAVGRGGVLDIAAQIRGRAFDMTEVHRFTDPSYAEVTVQMRDRRDPGQVFEQLQPLGLIRLHADANEMREYVAISTREGEVITVASNEEAARINDRIRDERIAKGKVDDTKTATGNDGLNIGRGDLIQTRKNSTDLAVADRPQWIVERVEQDGSLWVREAHSDRKRDHSVHLPAEYVREHAHLSYAATAYGVQGVTVPASHTILSEGMSGSAVYVGMTRGRKENALHVHADNMADARQQFVDALERDRADRGLTDATERSAEAVQGLVADGPVGIVNEEIERLVQEAERAERAADRWAGFAERLNKQRTTHKVEDEHSAEMVRVAEATAKYTRAEIVLALTPRATVDGKNYLAAVAREQEANRRMATVSRLGKRKARQEYRAAAEGIQIVGSEVCDAWGSLPQQGASLTAWAARAAECRAESDPRRIKADRALAFAGANRAALYERHDCERLSLLAKELGVERVRGDPTRARFIRPEREANSARAKAATVRREVEMLRTLSPVEAAARIEAQQAEVERARQLEAERVQQLRGVIDHPSARTEPHRDGPRLGL